MEILTIIGILVLPSTRVRADDYHWTEWNTKCYTTTFTYDHLNTIDHRFSSHSYGGGVCITTYFMTHHNKKCTSCFKVLGNRTFECTVNHGSCGNHEVLCTGLFS